jgi:hypothetical protein
MATLTDPVTGRQFPLFTRNDLGLLAPKAVRFIDHARAGDFGHHTVTGTAPAAVIVRGVQRYHMSIGSFDIGYSYLYDSWGNIYEGRRFGVAGGHTIGFNHTSHAFCFIGNSNVDAYTDDAKAAFRCLSRLSDRMYGPGRPKRGHGEVNATSCPGTAKQQFISGGMILPDTPPPPPPTVQPPAPIPGGHRYKYYRYPSVLSTRLSGSKRNDSAEAQFCINLGLGQKRLWTQVDGYYGSDTARAVRDFQTGYRRFWNDTSVVSDGVFGPQTAKALSFTLSLRGWGS